MREAIVRVIGETSGDRSHSVSLPDKVVTSGTDVAHESTEDGDGATVRHLVLRMNIAECDLPRVLQLGEEFMREVLHG